MHTPLFRWYIAVVILLTCRSPLFAGTVTSSGSVAALTDVSQLVGVVGTANFDEGPTTGLVPLGTYSPQGMTLHVGTLSSILPGVTTTGTAYPFQYRPHNSVYFPATIAGGGTHIDQFAYFFGAVTFSTTITQVGLTASLNGNQFLTAWNQSGTMLGQVNWTPNSDSAFIGIDTNGVPIGMVTYGNDNLFGGAAYDIGGNTIMADTMIWASGVNTAVPEPTSLVLWSGLGITGLIVARRRKRAA